MKAQPGIAKFLTAVFFEAALISGQGADGC